MLVANSTRFIIYAGFKLNQGYISSVLCENRDKPVLKCNGKCYLTKKLKQAEEKEKSQERDSQKNRFQDAFIQERITFNFPLELIDVLNSIVLKFKLSRHSSELFHPPKDNELS